MVSFGSAQSIRREETKKGSSIAKNRQIIFDPKSVDKIGLKITVSKGFKEITLSNGFKEIAVSNGFKEITVSIRDREITVSIRDTGNHAFEGFSISNKDLIHQLIQHTLSKVSMQSQTIFNTLKSMPKLL
uniref:Uncharacterized protein n=1 Tax=Megaselia scalaris TaxID=36166 RepID=T1GGN6_MEGSC